MQYILDLFVNYGVLAIIFIIGLIITIEDFKFGKIRNKWIKWGFIAGSAFYFLTVIILLAYFQTIDWYYYLLLLANTAIAFILGFILWHFKLWAGGDAKLFTLYVFLIPLFFYSNAYFQYWPALNLLINIILPIFVYLLIKMLLYPLQLGLDYLQNPKLLKEYYKNYKTENKIDKTKIKEYLTAALGFLLIMIFFQLFKKHVNDLLGSYLGSLITFFYLFMGFVIFKPLKKILQNRILLVAVFISAYFILGAVFFREIVYDDLHEVFALQIIFMVLFFYIFRYGKALGQFLYNSAEVKIIPVEEICPGIHINKDYVKKIMGADEGFDDFKSELEPVLSEDEKNQLWQLMDRKTDKKTREKGQYQFVSVFRNLNLYSVSKLLRQIYQYKKQKKVDFNFLASLSEKLNEQQKEKLEQLINNTDEISVFLKSIRGRLTKEQSEYLKDMLKQRNEKISLEGKDPINHLVLHKTFSFAPWMLLGVIITLLTKSSLIHIVYQLLGR